jgi:cytidine deaminase
MDNKMIRTLVDQAARVRLNARAVHSGFQVGAALLAADGKIYTGCNVEIGNMEHSICAERAAIAKAVSEGQQKFSAIAVIADLPGPCSPCGLCRQNLIDFAPDMDVIMATTRSGEIQVVKATNLLPYAFLGTHRHGGVEHG